MNTIRFVAILLFLISIFSCKTNKKEERAIIEEEVEDFREITNNVIDSSNVVIDPIKHATMILHYDDKTIYVDPTGGATAFENKDTPDMVLITDIHGDHMDIETLDSLDLTNAKIVVPQAVAEKLPASYTDQLVILNNGDRQELMDITVEAIPMYNLREEALKFHSKGRGNGYVLTLGDERFYISGDTEDIPEMRSLENIDVAFVCMNLPYTMPVESAADAVLAFKPEKIYPYHYRGTEGLSDVSKFAAIVNENDADIEVVQLDWYP